MSQLNMHVSPQFEKNLKSYMKKTGLGSKAEAIRQALQVALSAIEAESCRPDLGSLLGIGLKHPVNKKPRFKSDDDLWS
jgi:hypothetical protein